MKDFIVKLYENQYFPIYLGIGIAVLVVLFFIVLYLGKKDQKKLEQTRKLEKIDDGLFNDQVKAVKAEVNIPAQNETKENVNQTQTPAPVPVIPIAEPMPVLEPVVEEPIPTIPVEPAIPVIENTPVIETRVAMPNAESMDYSVNEEVMLPTNTKEEEPIVETPTVPELPIIEAPVVEPIVETPIQETAPIIETPIVEPVIEVPTVEPAQEAPVIEKEDNAPYTSMVSTFEDRIKALEEEEKKEEENKPKDTKVLNVFSSVYAPTSQDDIDELDLPKLKSE